MLYSLMDGRARTGTELSAVADVGTSTASAHLARLVGTRLVKVIADGRHRYYSLGGPDVAQILEGLSAIAGATAPRFEPSTPDRLRAARTCYDHIAGSLGVELHDRLLAMKWISEAGSGGNYAITRKGGAGLAGIGIDSGAFEGCRRRAAYGCLDWSERRCHIGGSLGAEMLKVSLRKRWLIRDLEGRGLSLSALGRQEFRRHFEMPHSS
jgi:DNA-binding transcriptional ArsR family regulator